MTGEERPNRSVDDCILLDENMFGRSEKAIGFPHLLLCMGFIVRTKKYLWGCHLTDVANAAEAMTGFRAWTLSRDIKNSDITDIYGICDFTRRYFVNSEPEGWTKWTTEMKSYAAQFSFTGQMHGFNTSTVGKVDGTYVEYRHETSGDRPCRIFYKSDIKTQSVGQGTAVIRKPDSDVVWFSTHTKSLRGAVTPKKNISGKKSALHSGKFHELGKTERLVTIAAA